MSEVKTPRSEFLLVPTGAVTLDQPARGHEFRFSRAQAEAAVQWFAARRRELVIDYEHQTFDEFNRRPDGLSIAAGWIGGLEARPDGLWATRVRWTPTATRFLVNGEYKYYSPVILWRDEAQTQFKALGPVALTNDPSMDGVQPLVAARKLTDAEAVSTFNRDISALVQTQGGATMDEKVLAALGLEAGASLEQVVAAIEQLKQELAQAKESGAGGSVTAAKRALVADLAERLGVQRTEDAAVLVTAVQAAQTEDTTYVSALRRTVTEQTDQLQKLLPQVAALQEQAAEAQFAAVIDGAEHFGKVPPADRDEFFSLFKSNRKLFDTMLRNMPPKIRRESTFAGQTGAAGAAAGGAAESGATDEEFRTVFKKTPTLQAQFGNDEEAYVAYRRGLADGTVRIYGQTAGA